MWACKNTCSPTRMHVWPCCHYAQLHTHTSRNAIVLTHSLIYACTGLGMQVRSPTHIHICPCNRPYERTYTSAHASALAHLRTYTPRHAIPLTYAHTRLGMQSRSPTHIHVYAFSRPHLRKYKSTQANASNHAPQKNFYLGT